VKTLFVKIASIVLILFVGISASANTSTNLRDTALMSSVYIPESIYKTTIVKKANVVYPGLFTPHLTNSISYVEKFSINRKKYLTVLYNKSKDFFPQVTEVFQQYNIPQEFKVLMAIESGFNANALSPVGALGY